MKQQVFTVKLSRCVVKRETAGFLLGEKLQFLQGNGKIFLRFSRFTGKRANSWVLQELVTLSYETGLFTVKLSLFSKTKKKKKKNTFFLPGK